MFGNLTRERNSTRIKRDDETEQYFFNWEDQLSPRECILTSSFEADTGLVVGSSQIMTAEYIIEDEHGNHSYSIPDQSTMVTLSGGTDGTTYKITNTITTSRGRTLARTKRLCVVDERDQLPRGGYPNRYQYR